MEYVQYWDVDPEKILKYLEEINPTPPPYPDDDIGVAFARHYIPYKRINHFREVLAQLKEKNFRVIPEEVYQTLREDFEADGIALSEITRDTIRRYLKKHSDRQFNQYYDQVPQIFCNLTGRDRPMLDDLLYEDLELLFNLFNHNFYKHCPPNRINFLSYSFVLHNFMYLLGQKHLMILFPLLKSPEKLAAQYKIWNNVAKDLGWPTNGRTFEDQKKAKVNYHLIPELFSEIPVIESIQYYVLRG